jgi:multicomponent Na+:H+ antiporter subunit D
MLLANLLITWLLLPFALAFLAALLPRFGAGLALLAGLSTVVVATRALLGGTVQLDLIGELGVRLQIDSLAAPFLLLNGLVVLAVLLDRWRQPPAGPFVLLLPVLLGGLNSAFLAVDLVSLYVALEVVGITAFLLILQKRDPRQLWVALRYLLVGNAVMTLYLVGVALLYLHTGSFRLTALAAFPAADRALAMIVALLLVGLLTKSGLFLSGLWLPRTHAEAPAEISALLSGVVVAGGLCPLLRLADQLPGLQPLLTWIGLASALLGLLYALLESDLKRLLAWSTLSQAGLILINPAVGGLYALSHGLAKAALFLVAGRAGTRNLAHWPSQPLPAGRALPLGLAGLSIAGAPFLLGHGAKTLLFSTPLAGFAGLSAPTAAWLLPLLSVGTAAVYARILWVPIRSGPLAQAPGALLLALLLLWPLWLIPLGSSPLALPSPAASLAKTLAVLAAGAGVEALRRALAGLRLPGVPLPDLERLVDLLGGMAVVGAGVLLACLGLELPLGVEAEVVAWRG